MAIITYDIWQENTALKVQDCRDKLVLSIDRSKPGKLNPPIP